MKRLDNFQDAATPELTRISSSQRMTALNVNESLPLVLRGHLVCSVRQDFKARFERPLLLCFHFFMASGSLRLRNCIFNVFLTYFLLTRCKLPGFQRSLLLESFTNSTSSLKWRWWRFLLMHASNDSLKCRT